MKRKWLSHRFNIALYNAVMWVMTRVPIFRSRLERFLVSKLGEISDFLLIRSIKFPQRGVVMKLHAKAEYYRELIKRHENRKVDMCHDCLNEITCYVLHVCSKYPNQLFLWDKKRRETTE